VLDDPRGVDKPIRAIAHLRDRSPRSRTMNSGMRWGGEGGQAILTARSWCQSDRFDRAWTTLAVTYKTDVRVIASVIELHDCYEKIGVSRQCESCAQLKTLTQPLSLHKSNSELYPARWTIDNRQCP
jgi:hypothetical protein